MTEENKGDNNDEEPLTPEEAPSEEPKKKNSIKRLLIILVPLILLIAAAIYFFSFIINGPKSHGEDIELKKPKENVVLDQNTYLDIDPITVGLSPSGPKREFLRLDMTLRINSEAESNAIMERMPIIKDSLIVFLRSLRATDFNSSSSSIYLKEEITKRINKITAPIKIKEVLFQEITVN